MRNITIALAIAAASVATLNNSAMAAPIHLTDIQMDRIVAGWDYCPPPPPIYAKGNNGWGNGADGTNPGSFHGGTSPSKSTNLSMPGAGKINTNPTSSTGR